MKKNTASWAELVCVVGFATSLGCSNDVDVPADAPTYYRDIQLMVQTECAGCHRAGGIGPFALDSYEGLVEHADDALRAIEAGVMPPWMPADDCHDLAGERRLSDAQIETFAAWVGYRTPMGDPADAPPLPDPPAPFIPTHTAQVAGGYLPNADLPDDYRCFALDVDLPEDLYLTGSTVLPGSSATVHHVLVYALDPRLAEQVQAADDADPGPGYTCFGGPLPADGAEVPLQIGAWVPGLQPDVLPAGRAIPIPADSVVVMQVHYNLLGSTPENDATEFQMQLTDEPPEFAVTTVPLPILELDIPAGEPRATHRQVFRNYNATPITLTSMTAHMHLLGTQISAQHVGALGTEERSCLLDIPDWDFNWQQAYGFPAGDEVRIPPGEGVELTCVYDNSVTNQPTINGIRQEPRDVSWGDGTLDEMCLLYVRREDPFAPLTTERCAALGDADCGCETDDVACMLGCESLDRECRLCHIEQLIDCTSAACGLTLLNAGDCLRSCYLQVAVLGGSVEACGRNECPEEFDSVMACIDPVVREGTCASQFAACGIE